MKIGVAIPCYDGHIQKLSLLLESIQAQTVIPDKVVVSCSSTNHFEMSNKYAFPLEVMITSEKLNAAQNRNKAISKLADMDYVTFMDADDVMHPQRIELLFKTIEQHGCDIILHNYQTIPFNDEHVFEQIKDEDIRIRTDSLIPSWTGCITHVRNYNEAIDKIHHSQVTVKQWILQKVRYPEEPEFYCREDCIFCYRAFQLPNIKHAYIANELSCYNPSKTGGISSIS